MPGNTTPERPLEVTAAVYLLYIGLLFTVTRVFLECSLPGGKSSDGLATLGVLPAGLLLYYMIGKGKNWARIILLILVMLGTLVFVVESLGKPPPSARIDICRVILFVAQAPVDFIALVFLFRPVSSHWFKLGKEPRENLLEKMLSGVKGLQEDPLKGTLDALRNTDQHILSYVWRAWLIAFIPSAAIGIIVGLLLPDKMPSFDGPLVGTVLIMVLIGPWLETLLMWAILSVLKRIVKKTLVVAVASAVIWGVLHSLGAPAHGLVIAWPFFVFSLCFLEWQKKSTGKALATTALVHMCQNALAALALVISVLAGGEPPQKEAVQPTPPPSQMDVTSLQAHWYYSSCQEVWPE